MANLTLNVQDQKSSVEIGQSAKGVWYIKSIKFYFQEETREEDKLVERLTLLRSELETQLFKRGHQEKEEA